MRRSVSCLGDEKIAANRGDKPAHLLVRSALVGQATRQSAGTILERMLTFDTEQANIFLFHSQQVALTFSLSLEVTELTGNA